MAAHTKLTPAFARPAGRPTPEDFDLGTETRIIWRTITRDATLRGRLMTTALRHIMYRLRRKDERSDPLEQLDRIIITMASVGYAEADVDLIIAHLRDVKSRVFCGNAHRTLAELDLEETKLEAEENELVLKRLHAGDLVTDAQLEHEATVNEIEANLQYERAKELRRLVRTRARGTSRILPFSRVAPVMS